MPNPIKQCLASLLLLASTAVPSFAAEPQIARVNSVSGEVSVERNGVRLAVKSGDPLFESDVVTTGPTGSVDIAFNDNTSFSNGPNSELALRQFSFDPTTSTGQMLAEMKHGTLSVVSGRLVKGSPGGMKVKTPTAVLNVRGTTFLVKVD